MEHQETSGEIFEKFTWKIANFSRLSNVETICSEPFVLGGYPWRIVLHPEGCKKDGNVAIYLEAVQMQIADVSKEWSRDVKFRLAVFNQLDNCWVNNEGATRGIIHIGPKNNFTKYENAFDESCNSWGYPSFMSLAELCDPQKGFIVNDVCIVGAEVFVRKGTRENRVSEAACVDLQVLWEELKKYRSDLTWLEPHVQSALRIKNYVEKTLHVEKLKKNVVDQELETKRLKTKLVAAEQNLNKERDLLKGKRI